MATSKSSPVGGLVAALRGRLKGRVIAPDDPDFAAVRRVWNGAIDRRPSAIAQCADAEDVASALREASDRGVDLTVRGGGHNVAGRSIRDGALLIDLSSLRSVVVNRHTSIASVQGGAQWADVDAATGAYGLATTGGMISTTGVGGFTLGGGVGWLMRRCGLACDNVLGATVVLADGRIVRASDTERSELFWGLRGGAGNLGVVTTFDLRLHTVANVYSGLSIYPAADTSAVLRHFREFAADAPDEFCGLVVLTCAPPFPFLDAAWHGKPVAILAACWCGEPERADASLAPLVGSPTPLAAHFGPMPYPQWQKMLDPAAPPGRFNYWKTVNFAALADDIIEQIAEAALHPPTAETEIHVQHLGGAVARVTADSTAFGSRETRFFVNLIGVTPRADAFPALRQDLRALHTRLSTSAMPSAMPNFTDADDGDPAASAGAAIGGRLHRLREQYDPKGLFTPR
jgi:hypothetical protein